MNAEREMEKEMGNTISSGKPWLRLERWMHRVHGLVFWGVVGTTGLIGFYLYVQTVSLIGQISALPTFWQYPAWLILGLLVACVLVAFLKLTWAYFRWRPNRQLRLNDLTELEKREELRELCREKIQAKEEEIYRSLRQYFDSYPQDSAYSEWLLPQNRQLGLTDSASRWVWNWTAGWVMDTASPEADYRKFQEAVRTLRLPLGTPGAAQTAREWITLFQNSFQAYLEHCAQDRLDYVAKIVAVKTAISPFALWDMLIGLFWSFRVLEDLCQVFHLRVGWYGTGSLLIQLWLTIFLSAQMDDLGEEYSKTAFEHITSGLCSNQFVQNVTGTVGAKMTSALTNYYLFRRLGRVALKKIRPLA